MKIYTKTGDNGETGLIGGKRVSKNHPRLEAYGTADELNSAIGTILSIDSGLIDIIEPLNQIQQDLFNIGAILATPNTNKKLKTDVNFCKDRTLILETEIDKYDEILPPLKSFILPGGVQAAAMTHNARTVCRRLERLLIDLSMNIDIDPNIIQYINRLSDYLFMLARYINFKNNVQENTWP